MQSKDISNTTNDKQLDSYSMLIVSKYFEKSQDYINTICVNSKFKETTEKLRFNPIPITSLKLFPKIQTQYLYSKDDVELDGINKFEIWFNVSYERYLKYKEDNIKCHHIYYPKYQRIQQKHLIPISVNILGHECFQTCELKTIIIPSHITSIEDNCFSFCSNTEHIELPNWLLSINRNSFFYCTSLISVKIPPSVQSIGTACFYTCINIKTLQIPNSVSFIGNNCFEKCTSLQSLTLPSSLVSLSDSVFSGCISLTNVFLPLSLTSIGNYCFHCCNSLTSILFPSSLQQIGNGCFKNCSNLKKINRLSGLSIGLHCFSGCNQLELVNE